MSKKTNMFDLSQFDIKDEPQPKSSKKELSPEEIQELLKDYVLVPQEKWRNIPIMSHLRYERTDGGFRKGGFLYRSWDKDGVWMFQFVANPRGAPGKGASWVVKGNTILRIWEKNKSAPTKNLKSLISEIEQIKVRQVQLANEQKRIITLIKKLHNIQM